MTGSAFTEFSHPLQSTVHALCGLIETNTVVALEQLRHEITHMLAIPTLGFTRLFLAEWLAGWAEDRIGRSSLEAWRHVTPQLILPPLSAILNDDDYLATVPVVNAFVVAAFITKYLIEEQGGLNPFWGSGSWRRGKPALCSNRDLRHNLERDR